MKRTTALPVLLLLLLECAGCDNPKTKPTNENYIKTLNAYFLEHSDCLLDGAMTFPLETSDPVKTKQMDALARAQIVEAHSEPAIHVSRYILTAEGRRVGTHLCYGHREVTEILSSTPPAKANGFVETQVSYRYKMEDLPVWAKTPGLFEEFPAMAKEASGQATDQATLAVTGVGWSVPEK